MVVTVTCSNLFALFPMGHQSCTFQPFSPAWHGPSWPLPSPSPDVFLCLFLTSTWSLSSVSCLSSHTVTSESCTSVQYFLNRDSMAHNHNIHGSTITWWTPVAWYNCLSVPCPHIFSLCLHWYHHKKRKHMVFLALECYILILYLTTYKIVMGCLFQTGKQLWISTTSDLVESLGNTVGGDWGVWEQPRNVEKCWWRRERNVNSLG